MWRRLKERSLCDRQQIVPINALIIVYLVVSTYATSIDHDSALWVCLGIQKVVAFCAELQGGLIKV